MDTHERQGGVRALAQKERVRVLLVNVAFAWIIFALGTSQLIPSGSGASLWFLAATTYWFLSLLGTPFFTPPKDSFNTAIAVILLLLPLDFNSVSDYELILNILRWVGIALAFAVATLALVAIFNREKVIGKVAYHLSRHIGRGEVLFTFVIVIASLGFFQGRIEWMYYTLTFWTVMIAIRPVELVYRAYLYVVESMSNELKIEPERVGLVSRVDDPNIVRVKLSADGVSDWNSMTMHVAHLPDGQKKLVMPLFKQTQNEEVVGTGLLCSEEHAPSSTVVGGVYKTQMQIEAVNEIVMRLSGSNTAQKVVGIVVENSVINNIRFQVVPSAELQEGMVVFTHIRGVRVYYQILDAATNEESFQQNPYGVHVATAVQLGTHDATGFHKFSWLPAMNQPLFLAEELQIEEEDDLPQGEFSVGDIPSTSFGVPVVLEDLVEYHTAILGMTGTAKTELAFDIIRQALDNDVKVFCVDFTGEYKVRLNDRNPENIGLAITEGSELEKLLFAVETGTYGAPAEKKDLQTFLDRIKPQISAQVEAFIRSPKSSLGIFELADITNTRASLMVTEMYLSAIMNWARANRKAKRIVIVLEEAHTIIPESYGSGLDGNTKWVVERIGQIALQGRKYGVGLMIISQRTALVSKTILSQCHTYFVHALSDKTSLEYLGNILAPEHIRAIPNLKFLEFIAHGKAIRGERSLLARRAYDATKAAASAALNVTLDATPVTKVVETKGGDIGVAVATRVATRPSAVGVDSKEEIDLDF